MTDTSVNVETVTWKVTVSLPPSTTITYKFLIKNADCTVSSGEYVLYLLFSSYLLGHSPIGLILFPPLDLTRTEASPRLRREV